MYATGTDRCPVKSFVKKTIQKHNNARNSYYSSIPRIHTVNKMISGSGMNSSD